MKAIFPTMPTGISTCLFDKSERHLRSKDWVFAAIHSLVNENPFKKKSENNQPYGKRT